MLVGPNDTIAQIEGIGISQKHDGYSIVECKTDSNKSIWCYVSRWRSKNFKIGQKVRISTMVVALIEKENE